MQLILERDGIKRKIQAPFAVCISSEDADFLIKEIRLAFRDSPIQRVIWITIPDKHVEQVSGEDPLPWTWDPPVEEGHR